MGDPVKASILSISTRFPLTERTLHDVRAIRLGLTGDRVAKTPVSGFFGLPLGWRVRMLRLAGVSFLSNH